jgi:hypothetical protein
VIRSSKHVLCKPIAKEKPYNWDIAAYILGFHCVSLVNVVEEPPQNWSSHFELLRLPKPFLMTAGPRLQH